MLNKCYGASNNTNSQTYPQLWTQALKVDKTIKFTGPFRIGRKQQRAVLDSNGLEVVIFPEHTPVSMVIDYCNFLNRNKNITDIEIVE